MVLAISRESWLDDLVDFHRIPIHGCGYMGHRFIHVGGDLHYPRSDERGTQLASGCGESSTVCSDPISTVFVTVHFDQVWPAREFAYCGHEFLTLFLNQMTRRVMKHRNTMMPCMSPPSDLSNTPMRLR